MTQTKGQVIIRINLVVQLFSMIVMGAVLIGWMFEPAFLAYFLYLLMPIGLVQVLFALLLRWTANPMPRYLNAYLWAVLAYFIVFALLLFMDRGPEETVLSDIISAFVFPFSCLYTLFFWWYSARIAKK